jgi:uncharacterized membrane protein
MNSTSNKFFLIILKKYKYEIFLLFLLISVIVTMYILPVTGLAVLGTQDQYSNTIFELKEVMQIDRSNFVIIIFTLNLVVSIMNFTKYKIKHIINFILPMFYLAMIYDFKRLADLVNAMAASQNADVYAVLYSGYYIFTILTLLIIVVIILNYIDKNPKKNYMSSIE